MRTAKNPSKIFSVGPCGQLKTFFQNFKFESIISRLSSGPGPVEMSKFDLQFFVKSSGPSGWLSSGVAGIIRSWVYHPEFLPGLQTATVPSCTHSVGQFGVENFCHFFFDVDKWNVGDRLERVFPKFEAKRSHVWGVNGSSKFRNKWKIFKR